jgi:molybdopterin-guanine dinucleotide biosynthesis protein A
MAGRGLTGVLLVGGASRRFGSPKALARVGEETLAERAWRILGEVCDERLAFGKLADSLELPFPVTDDQSEVRAPIAGLVAGLRAAANEVAIVLPVDTPLVTAALLRDLVQACSGDAAVTQTGPLPGAYRKSALPALERGLVGPDLSLRTALGQLDVTIVEADPALLANVNRPSDLPGGGADFRPER